LLITLGVSRVVNSCELSTLDIVPAARARPDQGALAPGARAAGALSTLLLFVLHIVVPHSSISFEYSVPIKGVY
jgi:hypothetical protein